MESILNFDIFSVISFPFDVWVSAAIDWVADNFRGVFQAIKKPIKVVLKGLENGLRTTPPTVIIAILALLGWQVAGRWIGFLTILAMSFIGLIGAWAPAMTSLAVLITSVILAMAFSLPLGILASRSDRFWSILRPLVDFMQTIPAFVYLVPIIMLFGIGNVPGVIITAFYASPPLIRLTNLGLREVRHDFVEAGIAFGSSHLQLLFKVELPLARPTIMAGLNQTVMLSLAMSVVASMISVAGLGRLVLIGIGQLDMAGAATGGFGIVMLAIVVDRITQGFGRTRRDRGHKDFFDVGPIGAVRQLLSGGRPKDPGG
jgi:glycine betaine/proline transport system permease protein